MTFPVLIPLLNPNEPEAHLSSLVIRNGQSIAKGDLLCSIETTKSTAEVLAEQDGYVIGLTVREGSTVMAGDLLCYLAESLDWLPPEGTSIQELKFDRGELPDGLRITQPALEFAREQEFDLASLPRDVLITKKFLQDQIIDQGKIVPVIRAIDYDPSLIIVYGGGGHGKSLIDLLRSLDVYKISGILDDGIPSGNQIMGVSVLGGAELLSELPERGIRQAVNAVGGIGNIRVRMMVFNRLAEAGFICPTLVHPSAVLEESATLGLGVQVFPLAYVGSEVKVGYGSIINTSAVVSHECLLGDYTNISPGALLAGGVEVGDGALIGMGATINLRVKIGAGARIGNSATVKEDVPENGIVRAGSTWPD